MRASPEESETIEASTDVVICGKAGNKAEGGLGEVSSEGDDVGDDNGNCDDKGVGGRCGLDGNSIMAGDDSGSTAPDSSAAGESRTIALLMISSIFASDNRSNTKTLRSALVDIS